MEPSEFVALASVIASGLIALAAIGVNAYLARRRMSHEEAMQAGRQAHERAEAMRSTAAAAYGAARDVLGALNERTFDVVNRDAFRKVQVRGQVNEAKRELATVAALGSNDEVRIAADGLIDAIDEMDRVAFATSDTIGEPHEGKAVDKFTELCQQTRASLEEYRTAVADA